jgi:hypothetical protein
MSFFLIHGIILPGTDAIPTTKYGEPWPVKLNRSRQIAHNYRDEYFLKVMPFYGNFIPSFEKRRGICQDR